MAFTSNINQAVLTSQQAHLAQQAADARQQKSLEVQQSESQKARTHDERMYNVRAGDAWMIANPTSKIKDSQISDLGDDVYNVYSNSLNNIKEGRDLLLKGNAQDRLKGQQMITSANNSIKELKLEYEIMEEDTQEFMAGNKLKDDTYDMVSGVADAYTKGNVRIVSSRTAGKGKDVDRWIEVTDEDTGKVDYVSFNDYKRALRNGLERVDVNAWVEGVSKNLEVDSVINRDGTSDARLKSPEAVETHVETLLSDDKVINALLQQFDITTPKTSKDGKELTVQERNNNDLSRLKTELTDLLKASKGIKTSKEPTASKKASRAAVKPVKGALGRGHRHWQILQGTREDDPIGSAKFLLEELKGTSPIKGHGVGDQVKNIQYNKGTGTMDISFVKEPKKLSIPWRQGPVNDLFSSFATNIDEQKYNIADVLATTAQQAIGDAPDVTLEVTPETTGEVITRLLNDRVDNEGEVNIQDFVKTIREGEEFGNIVKKMDAKNKSPWFGLFGKRFELFGTQYDLNTADGRSSFIEAFSQKVGDELELENSTDDPLGIN